MTSFTSLNSSFESEAQLETQKKKRGRLTNLFSRKKTFFRKRQVKEDQAAAGLVSNTSSPSIHYNTTIDLLTEKFESESEPDLISSATQMTDLFSQIDTPADNSERSDPIMSPDETLRDIQAFDACASVGSIDSQQSKVNKVLFAEEDNYLSVTPTKPVSATPDEELSLIETTPRTRNVSNVSVIDTTQTDQYASPIQTLQPSNALRLDDLLGAAVDVLHISKNAINIFSKEPVTDDSRSTQNYEDISKVLFVNGGVVTKKPLKSGGVAYCEAVTDVELLLRTPSRNERKTALIVGKKQSIVSSAMTPKREHRNNDGDTNTSLVDDIFDGLDDSPDRAIRFSNCNFQVTMKKASESFDFENAYNPFQVSHTEDQSNAGKETIDAVHIDNNNIDKCEELMESFDFENAEAFGKSLPPSFCAEESDSFDDENWEKNIYPRGSVTSSSEQLARTESTRDEKINSVIKDLHNLSIKRDYAIKSNQISPKSALQIMADKCKDKLDANVRKMAGASVSPEKAFGVDSEKNHQKNRCNEVVAPSAPKLLNASTPKTIQDRKTNFSPNNIFCFPEPNDTQESPKAFNNTMDAFVEDTVLTPNGKDSPMKMKSVRERVAFFNSQKW